MGALRGSWRPASYGTSLIRLLFTFQAALRGTDYLSGQSDAADSRVFAAPLWVWGCLFYGCALLILGGFALRRATPLVLGHALLAALYLGLGSSVLAHLPGGINPLSLAGAGVAGIGAYLLLSRHVAPRLGLLLALPLMVAGQLGIAHALGSGYRLGTGLVISGIVHGVFAVATLTIWKREQLAEAVEREG